MDIMALNPLLKAEIEKTSLTFEEIRAFCVGLALLTDDEQDEFLTIVREDPELIYPLYINYKAKLHAAHGTEKDWEEAIEQELIELEEFMKKKRVGNEIL